jgi:hypothetical protein
VTGSTEQILFDSGLVSAEDQLRASLREDYSLFIEEEQNLFVDEVRESQNWQRVLFQVLPELSRTPINLENDTKADTAIARWALSGLQSLNRVGKTDGPLGWTSKPAVYMVFVRILNCANAVLGISGMGDNGLVDIIPKIEDELSHVKDIMALHPMLLALADGHSL